MKWFKSIVYSGLVSSDLYQKKRGVVISNYISLILCFAITLIFILKSLFFGEIKYGMNSYFFSVGLTAFALPLVLNKLKLTTLSRLLLCIIPVSFLWHIYFSQMTKMEFVETTNYDTLRMFLLAFSFIPYLLFDRSKLWMLILAILPTLVSILCFEFILEWAGISVYQKGAVGEDYQLMQMRTLIAYIIISGGCFTFQAVISRNDEFNLKLVNELKRRREEIELQNEELTRGQEQLNEVNLHLETLVESKTENILKQNQILMKYAFTNAHHVRGPLARLLGLIQLSKMNTDLNYPWIFEKVELEAQEIDEIVKKIATDLNNFEDTEAFKNPDTA